MLKATLGDAKLGREYINLLLVHVNGCKESKVMSNEVSILHVSHTNTHDKEVQTRTFLKGNCIYFIIICPSCHPTLNVTSTSWTCTFALGFKPSSASRSLIIFFGSLQLFVTTVLTEGMTTVSQFIKKRYANFC